MPKTKNRQILILENPESKNFAQVIFVLKENVVQEEQLLLHEARAVVAKYISKYEKGIRRLKNKEKKLQNTLTAIAGGAIMGAFLSCLLFWF